MAHQRGGTLAYQASRQNSLPRRMTGRVRHERALGSMILDSTRKRYIAFAAGLALLTAGGIGIVVGKYRG